MFGYNKRERNEESLNVKDVLMHVNKMGYPENIQHQPIKPKLEVGCKLSCSETPYSVRLGGMTQILEMCS